MTVIRIVRDYPHLPAKVWRALTEPKLMALWGIGLTARDTLVGSGRGASAVAARLTALTPCKFAHSLR